MGHTLFGPAVLPLRASGRPQWAIAWATRYARYAVNYDPGSSPEADEWTRTDLFDRLDAIVRFHGGPGDDPGRATMHGWLHLVAENQLADGHLVATTKLRALVRAGVSRHEAIHAIGHAIMSAAEPPEESDAPDDLPDDATWLSPERQALQDEAIAAISADDDHGQQAARYVAATVAWMDDFTQGPLARELRRRILEIEHELGEDGVAPRLAIVEAALSRGLDGTHVDHAIGLLCESGDPRALAMLVRVAVEKAGHPWSDDAIIALRGRGATVVEPVRRRPRQPRDLQREDHAHPSTRDFLGPR
jgi:hypothetical protein